jgi:hypothetical protein
MTPRAHRRNALAADLGVGNKTVAVPATRKFLPGFWFCSSRLPTVSPDTVGKRTGGERAKSAETAEFSMLNDPVDHDWPPAFLVRRIFVR